MQQLMFRRETSGLTRYPTNPAIFAPEPVCAATGERARFLRAADSLSLRRRALCHVLAYAGCRVSEALALTLHHVDAERFTVTIRTLKRRKLVYRAVPVPQAVIEMLKRLPTDKSRRFWPMHRVTAWRVIKATMRRADISGPMACPKDLRHGFGIRAADRSTPTNLIQRWMGHASPTTTAIYSAISRTRVYPRRNSRPAPLVRRG